MIYDLLAPFYDAINSEVDYKSWADFIEKIFKKERSLSMYTSIDLEPFESFYATVCEKTPHGVYLRLDNGMIGYARIGLQIGTRVLCSLLHKPRPGIPPLMAIESVLRYGAA